MQNRGKFIVIDGLDGSGKGTIAGMLYDYLASSGKKVRRVSFPAYGHDSAKLVEMYLSGAFGEKPDDTNAYAASVFFAVDRYVQYVTDLREYLSDENAILISDRYTSANAVHQLSKLKKEEWDSFLSWLFDFEYNKMGIAAPDTVVYLEMKPEISRALISKRHDETGRTVDIHEKDREYLDRCYEAAMYACDKMGWQRVCNYDGNSLRDLNAVLAEVIEKTGLDK